MKYYPFLYLSNVSNHRLPQRPTTVIWDITSRCNLNCITCYNSFRYDVKVRYNIEEKDRELNTEEAKIAINKLKSFGFKHLHLLGGEPLIRPDIIELVDFATKLGLKVTVNTNGLMLTRYDFAKKLVEAGVHQITISLDGAIEETNDKIRGKGVYKAVLKALEVLNTLRREGYKIEIGLAYTMTKLNLHEMPSFVELASKYNVNVIDFMSLYISGNAVKNKEILEYTPAEALDALERLAEFISQNRDKYKNIIIQLDIWYPTAIYLERKYRVGFRYHPRNMGCMAVIDRIYMDAYGNLHPCGITTNDIYTKDIIKDKKLVPEKINILTINKLSDLLNSMYFKSFLILRGNKSMYLNKEPCKNCDYFSICIPCPIVNYSKTTIEECADTFKREKEFENYILNSRIKLDKNKILINNNKVFVYDKYKNVYREANKLASQIILEIYKENICVKDLTNKLKHIYSSISPRQIERDVIDFIWHLKILGVIELLHECKNTS
jgi:radical SAM protein with 4Fe4S-binding SPASM domain